VFWPWIGSRYGQANDVNVPPRLLIVGTAHYSHYYDAEGRPIALNASKTTQEVVTRHLGGESGRFFSRARRFILGRQSPEDDLKPFWQTVAFYNFITRLYGDTREVPSRKIFGSHGRPSSR